jgi:hypothetical protein
MYALSVFITGPGPDACAKMRAGDKAIPMAVVAVMPRRLRRFIVVSDIADTPHPDLVLCERAEWRCERACAKCNA